MYIADPEGLQASTGGERAVMDGHGETQCNPQKNSPNNVLLVKIGLVYHISSTTYC